MKSNLFIAEQFVDQACLNIPQGINLWHLVNHVLWANVPGAVVELGCLSGRTASMLARTMLDHDYNGALYLYDSFQGLSAPTEEDGEIPFTPAAFATTPEEVYKRFERFCLPQPIIVEGWFEDTLPHELPAPIRFAHVDADLYAPTKLCLESIYHRLSIGAIVVVDDYCDDELARKIEDAYNRNPYNLSPYKAAKREYRIGNWVPAVKRACDEFLADKPEEWTVMIAGEEKHAFFRKI